MRKGGTGSTTLLIGGFTVLAAACAVALTAGGPASAASSPDVTGHKYSDAQSAASAAGLTPVVSTVVGDEQSWPDCLVTRAQKRTVAPPADSSGSSIQQLMVSLNCGSAVASATKAGNSAASPEGRAAIAAAAKSSGG